MGETKTHMKGEREGWSVFQDTMITWSWGSIKGGVDIGRV